MPVIRPLSAAIALILLGAFATVTHAADHRVQAAGDADAPRPTPSDTPLYASQGGALFAADPPPDGIRIGAAPAWWLWIESTHASPPTFLDIPREPGASPWRAPRRPVEAQRVGSSTRIDHATQLTSARPARFALDGAERDVLIEVTRDTSTSPARPRATTGLRVHGDGHLLFEGRPELPPTTRRPVTTSAGMRLHDLVAEHRVAVPLGTRHLDVSGEPDTWVRVLARLPGSPPSTWNTGPHGTVPPATGDAESLASHASALAALPAKDAARQLSAHGYFRELPLIDAEGDAVRSASALLRILGARDERPDWSLLDADAPTAASPERLIWLPPRGRLRVAGDAATDNGESRLYRLTVSESAARAGTDAATTLSPEDRIPLSLLDTTGTRLSMAYDPGLAARLSTHATSIDGALAQAQRRMPGTPVIDASQSRLVFEADRRLDTIENLDPSRGVWIRLERHLHARAPMATVPGTPGLAQMTTNLHRRLRNEGLPLDQRQHEDRDIAATLRLVEARRSGFEATACANGRRPGAAQARAALAVAQAVGEGDPVLAQCALVVSVSPANSVVPEADKAFEDRQRARGRVDLITGMRASRALREDTVEHWHALASALREEGELRAAEWIDRVAAHVADGTQAWPAMPDAPVPKQSLRVEPDRSAGQHALSLASRNTTALRWLGTRMQPLHWTLPEAGRYRLSLRALATSDTASDATSDLLWLRLRGAGIPGHGDALLPLAASLRGRADIDAGHSAGPEMDIVFDSSGPTTLAIAPQPQGASHGVLADLQRIDLPATPSSMLALPAIQAANTIRTTTARLRWVQSGQMQHADLPLRIGRLPAAEVDPSPDAMPRSAGDGRLNFPDALPLLPWHDTAGARFPDAPREALVEALWLHEQRHPDALSAAGWAFQRVANAPLPAAWAPLHDRLRSHYRKTPYRYILSSEGQWLRLQAKGQPRADTTSDRVALGGALPENAMLLLPGRTWRLDGFSPKQHATLELTLHAALPTATLDVDASGHRVVLARGEHRRLQLIADAHGEVTLRLGDAMPATFLRIRLPADPMLRTLDSEPYHLPPLRIHSPMDQTLWITEWDGRRAIERQQWVRAGETVLRSERLPGAALRVTGLQPNAPLATTTASADQPAPSPVPVPPSYTPSSSAPPPATGAMHAFIDARSTWPGAYLSWQQRSDPDADTSAVERFGEIGARWRIASADGDRHLRLDAFARRHDKGFDVLGGEARLEWRRAETPWSGVVDARVLLSPGTRISGERPASLGIGARIEHQRAFDERWEATLTGGLSFHATTVDRITDDVAARIDSQIASRYRLDHPWQPMIEQRLRWRADWRTQWTASLRLVGNAPDEWRLDHARLGLDWHRTGPRWTLAGGADWRHGFVDDDRARATDRVRIDAGATRYWLGARNGWRLRFEAAYDLRDRAPSGGLRLEWFRHDGRGLQIFSGSEIPLRGVLEHDLHPSLRQVPAP